MAMSRKLHGHKKGLHIEAEGCIINIYEGLYNTEGKQVTAIQVIPDKLEEEEWEVLGDSNIRVIKKEDSEDVKKGINGN